MQREKSRPNRAYLLRCWWEGETAPGKELRWRFWLEEVLHERRQKGFSSLEALVAFLRAEFTSGEDEPSDDESQ
ncbi:MAG: hypothetical protein ACETWR_03515 [Anaerolineae bacterium]